MNEFIWWAKVSAAWPLNCRAQETATFSISARSSGSSSANCS